MSMAGTQLVYGDGWDDIKDCFGGSLGKVGRGLSRTPARPPSSRSGSSYYVGEVSSVRRTGGGNCEDCFEDLEEFCGCNMCSNDGGPCSRKRIGILVIFVWLFILTIICIVLGSNIAYTSGTAISERLGKHSEHHNVRMKEFSDDLSDLGSVHKQTNDKVDTVHGKVLNLRAELKRMERKMDGELQKRLSNVRSVLLGALDKAQKDITEIRNDVEKGMA